MRAGRGHAGRLSRRDALATVTDTDQRLLALLAEQRVLTQSQLERLLADTPGSAPFHYWPTRASDAFVRGEPVPRGGERAEPNPQFLHHAERLSELYVLERVQAQTDGRRLHAQQRRSRS